MATYLPPQSRKALNPDGTINILCRECGDFICKTRYAGFSTAICSKCQGSPVPDLAIQEEPIQELYDKNDRTAGKPSFIFKAVGFLKRKVKQAADASVQAARRKKRKPLMENPDEEKKEE